MQRRSPILTNLVIGTAAIALSIFYAFPGSAQNTNEASADRARQARIAELKAKIANLQEQLKQTQAEGQKGNSKTNSRQANQGGGCCGGGGSGQTPASTHSNHHPAGAIAQTGGGESSPGGEHPMGGMEGEMGSGMHDDL